MILEEPAGRYEICFPERSWPHEQAVADAGCDIDAYRDLKDSVSLRWATDEDLARVVAFLGGKVPIYRTVYRYRQFDTEELKPVKESAIVDKLFLEFEHKACGVLCNHVVAEVQRFTHWIRRMSRNRDPWLLLSGGKSIHFYVLFSPVELRRPHESIRRILKKIEKRARLLYADPHAMNGVSQVARVMNAQNPRTGLFAIPVSADEVLRSTASSLLRLAEQPRVPTWTPHKCEFLREVLLDADARIVEQELMDQLFPPPKPDLKPGEVCENVKRTLEAPPDHEVRGHKGQLALVTHCFNSGMSPEEAFEFVVAWNRESVRPMTSAYLRNQVTWFYKNQPKYTACLHVVQFFGSCPKCGRVKEPESPEL